MNVVIRPEMESDFSAIDTLYKLAFGQDNEAKLVSLLRNTEHYIPKLALVATIGNVVVGHILFTKINIINPHGKEAESLALAPMGVLPKHQKQGIGGQLIRVGLNKAQELGHQSVIVLGHEQYYPKFGFMPAERWKIKAPFEVPTNAFMGVELVKDGLKHISGTVQYPKEFEMV